MDNTTNSLNWFEIPVADVKRAKEFYQKAFDIEMMDMSMDDSEMAFFPWAPGNGKATGSLVQSPNHKPSMEGSVVYLNGNPNMDPIMERVEAAGGKVLMAKKQIAEDVGYMALFLDSEGNRMALHSQE